jgi:hypothetical protein
MRQPGSVNYRTIGENETNETVARGMFYFGVLSVFEGFWPRVNWGVYRETNKPLSPTFSII